MCGACTVATLDDTPARVLGFGHKYLAMAAPDHDKTGGFNGFKESQNSCPNSYPVTQLPSYPVTQLPNCKIETSDVDFTMKMVS